MEPLVFDGIAERARDVLLPRHLLEGLRAPFACDDLISHIETVSDQL